ncbi:MAG: hypothetical protein HKN31_14525, partial [Pricia sp.]|nr:hypothetical protein [Pricia sp.]
MKARYLLTMFLLIGMMTLSFAQENEATENSTLQTEQAEKDASAMQEKIEKAEK